jgi:transposase-like protein
VNNPGITLDFEEMQLALADSNLNNFTKYALQVILEKYMLEEREAFCNAGQHERSEARTDYANGFYERTLLTSTGKLELKVPRTRSGKFATDAFAKYERQDQALMLAMMEMYVNGVSTRHVTRIIESLCGESVSKSLVSTCTQRLDVELSHWRHRDLSESHFDYLYADAMYVKVREDKTVKSKAVHIILGVNDSKRREIIGLYVSDGESSQSWGDCFRDLKSRGINTPRLVISDAHEGLKNAIQTTMTGARWQRCVVHFLRNMVDHMPRNSHQEARELLKSIFSISDLESAETYRDTFLSLDIKDKWYSKVCKQLEAGFDDATQFFTEKTCYHINLRTTNVLERLNKEVRRRERVVSIFPNEDSLIRLVSAVLMDYEETMDTGNRTYLKEK